VAPLGTTRAFNVDYDSGVATPDAAQRVVYPAIYFA
jgi:hypothetical protein